MKTKTKVAILLTSIAVALFAMTGCVATPTPVVTQEPHVSVDPISGRALTNYVSVTNVVYAPSPWVGQVQSGGALVAPFIPPPYNSAIPVATGLLAAAAAAYAAYKNKQKNSWQDVATTVIEGVESLGPTALAAKEAIKATAIKNGTADVVHAAIKENT